MEQDSTSKKEEPIVKDEGVPGEVIAEPANDAPATIEQIAEQIGDMAEAIEEVVQDVQANKKAMAKLTKATNKAKKSKKGEDDEKPKDEEDDEDDSDKSKSEIADTIQKALDEQKAELEKQFLKTINEGITEKLSILKAGTSDVPTGQSRPEITKADPAVDVQNQGATGSKVDELVKKDWREIEKDLKTMGV